MDFSVSISFASFIFIYEDKLNVMGVVLSFYAPHMLLVSNAQYIFSLSPLEPIFNP